MSGAESISKQAQTIYEDYEKIKAFVDVGYFLIDYVVTGGEVTKDVTHNNQINVAEIVASLDNDVTRHEAISFKTQTPNTVYYLDYLSDGKYSFGTAHYNGSYLPIAEVTTDANGNVSVITDKRGDIGGFRLRPGYDYPELNDVVTEVQDARIGADGVARNKLGTLVREIDAKSTIDGINRNAIINGNFSFNQRDFRGAVTLAAGAYGHDRWKAGSGGCTYTFSTSNGVTTITIVSGSLVQVIEGLNLFGGKYTLSWTGTAQGKIGTGSYGASGIIADVTGGVNLAIEFSSGTLGKVQFNAGDVALPFQPRSFADELALCRRYLFVLDGSDNDSSLFGTTFNFNSTLALATIILPVKMRLKPTLVASESGTFHLLNNGTIPTLSASPTINQASSNTCLLNCTTEGGLIGGQGGILTAATAAGSRLIFDAEI